jgi:hypothetical protein
MAALEADSTFIPSVKDIQWAWNAIRFSSFNKITELFPMIKHDFDQFIALVESRPNDTILFSAYYMFLLKCLPYQVAALLIPLAHHLLLGTAVSTAGKLVVAQATVNAQGAE